MSFSFSQPPPRVAPIWAPNPGVPSSARVLAWSFGGTVLLTIALTFLLQRPADIPPMPAQWLVYRTQGGSTVPYPVGWMVHTMRRNETERAAFDLPPGNSVHIECSVSALPIEADALVIQQIARQVDRSLETRFKHFRAKEDATNASGAADLEEAFTYRDGDAETPKAGVWMLRTRGKSALLLVAVCSEEAYPAVRQIANHMVTFAELK